MVCSFSSETRFQLAFLSPPLPGWLLGPLVVALASVGALTGLCLSCPVNPSLSAPGSSRKRKWDGHIRIQTTPRVSQPFNLRSPPGRTLVDSAFVRLSFLCPCTQPFVRWRCRCVSAPHSERPTLAQSSRPVLQLPRSSLLRPFWKLTAPLSAILYTVVLELWFPDPWEFWRHF